LAVACSKAKLDQSGQVNPRVLKNVLDEGRFVEDAVATEYFGGLLASSRTEDGKDDSALPMVTLLRSMSADQIRLHYVIYTLLSRHEYSREDGDGDQFWDGLEIRLRGEELVRAMGCDGTEGEARIALALSSLCESHLLGPLYALRLGGLLTFTRTPTVQDGLIADPTKQGARLFLRAIGLRGLSPEVITSVEASASLSDAVSAIELPKEVTWRRRKKPDDQVSDAKDELEGEISDLRSTVEELESTIEHLKTEMEEVQSAVTQTTDEGN
jgi:hypothetical protein